MYKQQHHFEIHKQICILLLQLLLSLDGCCPFKMEYLKDGTPGSLFVLQADVEEKVIVESSLNINEKRKKIVNALNAVMDKIQPLSQHSVLL